MMNFVSIFLRINVIFNQFVLEIFIFTVVFLIHVVNLSFVIPHGFIRLPLDSGLYRRAPGQEEEGVFLSGQSGPPPRASRAGVQR